DFGISLRIAAAPVTGRTKLQTRSLGVPRYVFSKVRKFMTLRPPCAGALRRRLALFSLFAILLALPAAAGATSPGIVISQVYGGGGNSGATYKNDFIDLFNRGPSPVNETGCSVQSAAHAGTTRQVH